MTADGITYGFPTVFGRNRVAKLNAFMRRLFATPAAVCAPMIR